MSISAVQLDQAQIDEAIKLVTMTFPGEIERIRYSIGDDWANERALFFRVLLKDSSHNYDRARSGDKGAQQVIRALNGGIMKTLAARLQREDYQPYFSFRTAAEQLTLDDPQWV